MLQRQLRHLPVNSCFSAVLWAGVLEVPGITWAAVAPAHPQNQERHAHSSQAMVSFWYQPWSVEQAGIYFLVGRMKKLDWLAEIPPACRLSDPYKCTVDISHNSIPQFLAFKHATIDNKSPCLPPWQLLPQEMLDCPPGMAWPGNHSNFQVYKGL